MTGNTKIVIAPVITVTLTEEEAAVWEHISGYNVEHMLQGVTGRFDKATLERTACSIRNTLATAIRKIEDARIALSNAGVSR